MRALGLWVRSEHRRQLASLAMLALVLAFTTTVVLTAALGARRSPGAFDRLRDATFASDFRVCFSCSEEPVSGSEALGALGSIDGVVATGIELELSVSPDFEDLYPGYHISSIVLAAGATGLDQPIVRQGRAADPDAPDEVVVSERLAEAAGLDVGDRLTLRSATTEWVDASSSGAADPGPPDGPAIDATVVGIVRTPADFGERVGLMLLTPAFAQRYAGGIAALHYATARFADPDALERFRAGGPGLAVSYADGEPTVNPDAGETTGLGTVANGLWVVAGLATATGLSVAGQLGSRVTRGSMEDRPTLAAMGWGPRDVGLAAGALLGPTAGLGVLIGTVVSVAVSPWGQVGLAEQIDPDPGAVVFSPVVHVGGAAVALGLVVAGAAAVARAVRPVVGPRRIGPRWPPLRRPVAPLLGARAVLNGQVSRGACVVGALAVAGSVAALAVGASIDRLGSDLTLSGQTGSFTIEAVTASDLDEILSTLAGDPRTAALASYHAFFPLVEGLGDQIAFATDNIIGNAPVVVFSGRAPAASKEVVLGPATMESLDVSLGDTVTLANSEDPTLEATYEVVGSILFPPGELAFDAGFAMTSDAAKRLIGDPRDHAVRHGVDFNWKDGVDVEAANAELTALGYQLFTESDTLLPLPVTRLAQVEGLTRFLAMLLGLLSVGTLGHGLLAGFQRGRGTHGVLRALGLGPAGGATVVVSAGGLAGLAVLVVGIPFGMVVGRLIWRYIATEAHLIAHTVQPAGVISATAAALVVALSILALLAALRTWRLRPAEGLRAE